MSVVFINNIVMFLLTLTLRCFSVLLDGLMQNCYFIKENSITLYSTITLTLL